MAIEVDRIVTGRWKENCFVVSHAPSRDALIIDPGNNAEDIAIVIERKRLRPLAILNTHGHFDHIGAVSPLKDRYELPFYLHGKDLKLVQRANFYRTVFDEPEEIEPPEVDYRFEEQEETLVFGPFSVRVVATPGHTKGSVCFLIDDLMFTGDTLFRGKIGRTDLPGGSKRLLADTLRHVLTFPGDTVIYPGHGGTSTIGEEMEGNLPLKEVLS